MGRWTVVAGLLAGAWMLSGFRPLTGREPRPLDAPAGARLTGVISCTASLSRSSITCTPGAPTLRSGLGGEQERGDVSLTFRNVRRDRRSGVVRAEGRIGNGLVYALGTPDGNRVTGLKVFYVTQPPGEHGSGRVQVQGVDGCASFTAAAQPYYAYRGLLRPGAVSAGRTWEWQVPGDVDEFRFSVDVLTLTRQEAMVPMAVPDSGREPRRFSQAPYLRFCSAVGVLCVYDVVNVEFKPDATQEQRQAAVDLVGGMVEGGMRAIDAYYVRIPSDTTGAGANAAAARLRSLPQVASAFPHMVGGVYLNEVQVGPRTEPATTPPPRP